MVIGVRFFYFVNPFLNFHANCPHGAWRRVFFNSCFGPSGNHPHGDCWRALFFFSFLFLKSFSPQSQSLNGDWWRGLFRPLSQSPRWRLVVRGLFFSILFGYAHFSFQFFSAKPTFWICFSAMPFFSVFFFCCVFFFRPCKPVAQMRLVVRGQLLFSSANYFPACNGCVKKTKKQHTSAFCVYERVGGPSLGTQNAGVYSRGSY